MMTEDRFTERLSEYLDGELDRRARAEIDAHLRACAGCRTTLEELRAVTLRARALGGEAPERDLWPGIAARLEPRSPRRTVGAALREAARRRFAFTVPQLAAAALALMVLSGGLVWMARSGDPRADFPPLSAEGPAQPVLAPADFGDAQYDRAVADLERTLSAGRATLDPQTVRVLEANLRAIDEAIDQSRQALATDPGNTYLNGHLAGARQRKLALLRRASGLSMGGS